MSPEDLESPPLEAYTDDPASTDHADSASSTLRAALTLAEEHGIPVFPCRVDKRPYTAHGFQEASCNIEQIVEWWTRWPDAFVGVPTGRPSHLVVIDVDPDGAGWYRQHANELGCGRVHRTHRGHHLLYCMPEIEVRNSASKIAGGVDVRGEGGYVVWWPAHGLQATGSLEDLTEPPQWLLELIEKDAPKTNGHDHPDAHLIPKGRRNEYLSREAYRSRKQGATVEQITETLRVLNRIRLAEPLNDEELRGIARGKQQVSPDEAPPRWEPPAVVTYGAGFDPSKIPLRRWILGRRRAIGEVTVDAGPPGVNKSMLMLTDAVSIVTGRAILSDRVYETGEVLFLAGEDARRDVEARIAGILTRYHIPSAELADRLHLVYLAEIDPVAYTLAQMSEDTAMLNANMLGWLRAYPGVIAVFVDPLLAWHQLIENSNEALQLLGTALRGIAVQGNRHVGIDHHVTKVAMADPEAHVGNIAGVRGASTIMAYTRWAFTMARLKSETAQTYGILEDEAKRYRRLDALKASHGPDDDPMRLLRVESVQLANGESAGVLIEMDMDRVRTDAEERRKSATEDKRTRLAAVLSMMLTESRPRTASATALWLITHYPEFVQGKDGSTLSEFTARRRLPTMIGEGLPTSHQGYPARIVIHERSSNGKGAEIDFEQVPQ